MKNDLCLLFRPAAGLLLIILFSGCEFTPPRDADGNDPVDVARKFVEFARAGDTAGAASCWREGDVSNIEANRNESFSQYCQYFRSETYRLQYEGSDKGVYWVRFFGTDAGKTRARILYVDPPENSKDGRWKLRESRWIKDNGQAPAPKANNEPEPHP
jgi:hypothetical protein